MDRGTRQQVTADRPGQAWFALACGLALLAGCAHDHCQLEQALAAYSADDAHCRTISDGYEVACPDVLDVRTVNRPDLTGLRPVGADGRIDLGPAGRVRVEGLTVAEVARCVAREAEVRAEAVTVRVAEYRSQQVYLFGEVTGQQRPVPYVGPETVLDLLHRTGGITAGAAEGDVYIVRPHVTDGGNPEVFHVDLKALLCRHDPASNVRVAPFDQVYVGASKKCRLESVVPPVLRPAYEKATGLSRP